MADTKISALTDGTAPAGSDQFAVARAGANNSLTWTELLTAVKAVTLDLFAAPGANVAMNAKKLTGLAAGSTAGDSLRYEQLFAAGAVPIADLADPTTGKVIGSTSNAAAAVYPPGFEIGYNQITSAVNVASTTEGTSTTIITASAYTFDGAAVIAEFFTPGVSMPSATSTNDFVSISLWESTTQLGRFSLSLLSVGGSAQTMENPVLGRYRFTPSAGSHTYTVQAFTNSTTGTPQVQCGAGGVATLLPAYLRFTKV